MATITNKGQEDKEGLGLSFKKFHLYTSELQASIVNAMATCLKVSSKYAKDENDLMTVYNKLIANLIK